MKFKIINDLAILLDNSVPEKYLFKLHEFLLGESIFTDASKVLPVLVIFIMVSEIALAIAIALLGLPASLLILPFFSIPIIFTYILVLRKNGTGNPKYVTRFLRQFSSMLQVWLSFENAMEGMSQYGKGHSR